MAAAASAAHPRGGEGRGNGGEMRWKGGRVREGKEHDKRMAERSKIEEKLQKKEGTGSKNT